MNHRESCTPIPNSLGNPAPCSVFSFSDVLVSQLLFIYHLLGSVLVIFVFAHGVGTKPGLWTLDWTMDWIMDSILDLILDWKAE